MFAISDELALADTVVLGRVQSTNVSEDLGDGYRSTVSIVVEEARKGSFAKGQVIKLRRKSGVSSGSALTFSSEDTVTDGTAVALVGSKALYDFEAGPGKPCKDCVLEQVPVLLIQGTSLVPSGGSTITGLTLDLN